MAAQKYISSLPQAEHETLHYFANGVYCRQLNIPNGTVLIGKIHKYETLNVLLSGSIEIAMETGGVSVMKAPYIFVSPPGTQKVGRTLEDTIWLNFHSTENTDLDKIEEQFTADSYEEYDSFKLESDNKKLLEKD